MNLMHIESRSSKRSPGNYEFIVEIQTGSGDVEGAIEGLKQRSAYFQIISRDYKEGGDSANRITAKEIRIKRLITLWYRQKKRCRGFPDASRTSIDSPIKFYRTARNWTPITRVSRIPFTEPSERNSLTLPFTTNSEC